MNFLDLVSAQAGITVPAGQTLTTGTREIFTGTRSTTTNASDTVDLGTFSTTGGALELTIHAHLASPAAGTTASVTKVYEMALNATMGTTNTWYLALPVDASANAATTNDFALEVERTATNTFKFRFRQKSIGAAGVITWTVEAAGDSAVTFTASTTVTTAPAAVSTQHPSNAFVAAAGNIGIGTESPAYSLDVEGTTNLLVAIPGMIVAYGGSSAPADWLLCDGSAVSRTTYAALFAVLGTAYGAGDGSTTFNVPDLSGRTPVGVDGGAGRVTANNARGQSSGSQASAHTHTGPSHTHGSTALTAAAHTHTGPSHTHGSTALTATAHTHTAAAHSHTMTPGTVFAQIQLGGTGIRFKGFTGNTWNASSLISLTVVADTTSVTAGVGVDGASDSTTPGASGSTTPNVTGTTDAAGTGASGSTTPNVTGSTDAAGTGASGSTSPSNMPPYQVVNYIVKT